MSKYRITLEGKTYEMDVELIGANGVVSQSVKTEAKPAVSAPKAAPAAPAASKPVEAGSGSVAAPMPGTILKVLMADGDQVKAGEVVLVLEAMKMDNDMTAPCAGKVSFKAAVGSNVDTGDVMAVIG